MCNKTDYWDIKSEFVMVIKFLGHESMMQMDELKALLK